MSKIDSNLQCPSCRGSLVPKVLACDGCNIKVEGPFQLNEFATLAPEDLHFLRIFVRCEGRVREMESALGLSYPTIRARLTELKNVLGGGEKSTSSEEEDKQDSEQSSAAAPILEQLQAGKISFDEAMTRIKKARSGAGTRRSKV